ncbi:MAG: serine/threonine protein kinase, partial [Planctomycetaceae bacterium]|nr:serine/threonine protein kinase [Planctomycetaceae bacterium]
KPENILINHKGVVKVADFGLAQLTRQSPDKSALELTQVGTTMGTPLYMSPEQVHGAKLDQRSDLYSLGVTSFHMLAGEPPFQGESAMSVAIQHLNEKPPRLKDRRPDLPPALCQIVHKLMAKDMEKRYQSASEVLKDIKQIQTALKQEVDPASLNLSGFDLEFDDDELIPSWIRKMSGWSNLRKTAVYSVLCLLIAGIAAGVGWWLKPKSPLDHPIATQPKITAKPTIKEQYDLALQNQQSLQSFADEEEAWKAVIDHADQDKRYRYLAYEHLGAYYVHSWQLDRAAKIFSEMVELKGGQLELTFHFKGLVGQAVIASLKGQNDQAWKLLKESNWESHLESTSPLRSFADALDQQLAPTYRYKTE